MGAVGHREVVAETSLPGTDRRVVVWREYRHALDHPPEIVSPLQSEFTWFLGVVPRRRRNPVTRCEIKSWTGDFDGVFPAPYGGLAAVRWNDQTEAGLVLVDLDEEPHQLEAAWDTRRTNWLEGPVWWPDASGLVLVENPGGAGPWWAQQGGRDADDEDVSPGGTFTPGTVVVLDRDLRERSRVRIEVDLPPRWYPAGDEDRGLGNLRLGPTEQVVMHVPSEGDRTVSLTGR
jgi:hypothetical protein